MVWEPTLGLLGALYALPATIVALDDPRKGAAMAIGVIPAALLGLMPSRRRRLAAIALGVLTGVPMLLGGILAGVPVLAVIVIGLLGVGVVNLATHSRVGMIAMLFSYPMVGIGLSYSDVGVAAGLAVLIVAGSVWGFAVSLLWPERPPGPAAGGAALGPPPDSTYGLRLGAAGAAAAAFGFVFGLEHVGWATAAALLVMRPEAEMLRLRSAGRIVSVAIGALAAILLVRISPADSVYALLILLAVSTAAATHRSRWYVTPVFTTYLVFLLLLYADPGQSASRFAERLVETAIGVGLAYFFGLGVPALLRRRTA